MDFQARWANNCLLYAHVNITLMHWWSFLHLVLPSVMSQEAAPVVWHWGFCFLHVPLGNMCSCGVKHWLSSLIVLVHLRSEIVIMGGAEAFKFICVPIHFKICSTELWMDIQQDRFLQVAVFKTLGSFWFILTEVATILVHDISKFRWLGLLTPPIMWMWWVIILEDTAHWWLDCSWVLRESEVTWAKMSLCRWKCPRFCMNVHCWRCHDCWNKMQQKLIFLLAIWTSMMITVYCVAEHLYNILYFEKEDENKFL